MVVPKLALSLIGCLALQFFTLSAYAACQVSQELESGQMHLSFIEGVEVKVGVDSGRPAAKMKVAGTLGSSEYTGSWVSAGELIKISAVRSYSGQKDKKLASLYAFLDARNQLNWMVVYTGKHLSTANTTVVASNGSDVVCEELTTDKEISINNENLRLSLSTISTIDDSLVFDKLGL